MNRTQKKGRIVFAVIVFLAALSLLYEVLQPGGEQRTGAKEYARLSLGKGYIAELHVTGVIAPEGQSYNQAWIMDTVASLEADSRCRGIMLYLDTPGGTVYEADELFLALTAYKEKTGKPVYAYMAHMAASAGYYIACSADKIFANRNTLTGSIGVIFGGSLDATGLLEKLGVKSETFHAGKNKNMLNYNEPLTAEQRQIMQSAADEAYAQFTGIVASSRKMELAAVQALADGRIYTAQQALENGLVDVVCQKSEAYDSLRHDFQLDKGTAVKKFAYEPENFLQSLLLGMGKAAFSGRLQALSERLELQSLLP